jgi:hypothetical protein
VGRLGPQLVAVAGECGDVEPFDPDRPEASVAGVVEQVALLVCGGEEDALALSLGGEMTIGETGAVDGS